MSYASSSYTSLSWGESLIDNINNTEKTKHQEVTSFEPVQSIICGLTGLVGIIICIVCIAVVTTIILSILGIDPGSIFKSHHHRDERDRRLYELLNDDL